MGQSTDGILFYGVPLGDEENFGPFDLETGNPPWHNDDNYGDSITESANNALKAAAESSGIRRPDLIVAEYCSDTSPMYLLAAKLYEAGRGHLVSMDTVDTPPHAVAYLLWAAGILGMKDWLTDQPPPRWHLASYWAGGASR